MVDRHRLADELGLVVPAVREQPRTGRSIIRAVSVAFSPARASRQRMAKTPICALMRVRRETVGRIVERVVGDHLDSERLRGLVIIGVDEVSYRTGEEGDDVLEVASVAGAGSGERRAGSNPSSVARAAKTGRRSAAIRRARRSQPRAVVSGTP
ncbi:MAG: hypothetical protein ACRDL3_00915, partial [Solirubrobacterales bacterium]